MTIRITITLSMKRWIQGLQLPKAISPQLLDGHPKCQFGRSLGGQYTYVSIYVYMHIYIHAHVYIYIYAHIYIYTYKCRCIYIYVYVHVNYV